MTEELTKDEADQRARELARRVMSKPYKKQEWPRQPKPARETKPKKVVAKPAS
jgi:hypothetical protein